MNYRTWASVAEGVSGVCFIISSLFLSNLTGAFIGTNFEENRTYGFALLVLAVSAASLFMLFRRKASKDIKTLN